MFDFLEIRNAVIDPNVSDSWYWPKDDTGAWQGPVDDWQTSHFTKYYQHVKKFDVVVTAGANMGLYARAYSHKFNRVYAFEPDALNFLCLSMNTPYQNVIKFNCALGDMAGFCSMNNFNKTNLGTHTINTDIHGPIPIMTIDSLNLDACDLIQLDVERYEYEVLCGARETIKKFRPVVIAECGNDLILNLLRKFGYTDIGNSVSDTIYIPE